MVSISSWRSDLVTGVLCPKIHGVYPRLPSHIVSYKRSTLKSPDCVQPVSRKVPGRSITHLSLAGRAVKCASFVERNYQSSVNDDEDPFWINATKQAVRYVNYSMAAKSILEFLVEQPSQLKYIEWPGFQSTPYESSDVYAHCCGMSHLDLVSFLDMSLESKIILGRKHMHVCSTIAACNWA
ncbi:hypothetical protein MTR67_024370 [Solanum verrucosum]|uniref:Uncharacterized protein n=1 Tax=Solanum verrucosum TaxID=315347 RepID=A0AAF0TYE4_SOLVR|nr:hypothetical protein MTR67_024370 [Solanum verrucosum]